MNREKPVRIVFGPTHTDPVHVFLPDGRDIASELRITSIRASIEIGGVAKVDMSLEAPAVEVLELWTDNLLRRAGSENEGKVE